MCMYIYIYISIYIYMHYIYMYICIYRGGHVPDRAVPGQNENSCKDDPAPQPGEATDNASGIRSDTGILNGHEQNEENLDGDNENEEDFSFLGYVYPTPAERL